MDCADYYIVKLVNVVDSGVNDKNYGSTEDTKKANGVYCSNAHEEAAFGLHAAGIRADFHVKGSLRPPPPILDYSLSCDSDQSKALGSGYNDSYFICVINTNTTGILITYVKLTIFLSHFYYIFIEMKELMDH